MKIVVSACLLGRNCKYNGGSNRNEAVLSYIEGKEIIPVCPEVTGGLSTPRIPVELKDGRAINAAGEDVTAQFEAGVRKTMEKLAGEEISLAILQPRSPSCGCKQIYDGTFSKTLIEGKGMFAQALAEAGIAMVHPEELSNN